MTQINRKIKFMKCAEYEESGDKAICLFYSGSGSNYVFILNPGEKPGDAPSIDGFKEICIPPSNENQYEYTINTFDFSTNIVVKSIRNRSREFEMRYDEDGEQFKEPHQQSYAGFLVWDITSDSHLPVRQKYFTARFTDFTIAGGSIWTCSPQDRNSSMFNLSLELDISKQTLTIPNVDYLRNYFENIYLRATFQNGSLIKIPFSSIFLLPENNTFHYTIILLGLLAVILVGVFIGVRIGRKYKYRAELAEKKKSKVEGRTEMQETTAEETMSEIEDLSQINDESTYRSKGPDTSRAISEVSHDIIL